MRMRMSLFPGEAPPPQVRAELPLLVSCAGLSYCTMTLEAIRYSRGSLQILDQLLLPQQSRYEAVGSVRQAWEAIRAMKVRRDGGAAGLEVGMRQRLQPPTPESLPAGAGRPGHSPGGLSQSRRGAAGGRRGSRTRRTRGLRARQAELPRHRPAHRCQHGPRRPRPG